MANDITAVDNNEIAVTDDRDVVVKLSNVTKRYKLYKNDKKRFLAIFSKRVKYTEKRAVDDVSFEVRRGESVALFGRNGAGKSTILKMITGVTYPSDGCIEVKGRVSALLELTSGFDKELTGRENIYLKGQILGLRDEEIAELEDKIIDFAEIGEYIDQPVRTYSSGMRARLGFAVNVNINPEILIVDEALSVGDRDFKNKCLEKVTEIIDKDHVTLLFVTHATGTAMEFCKRGIVMKNGKMVCDKPISEAVEIYSRDERKRRRKKRIEASDRKAELQDQIVNMKLPDNVSVLRNRPLERKIMRSKIETMTPRHGFDQR